MCVFAPCYYFGTNQSAPCTMNQHIIIPEFISAAEVDQLIEHAQAAKSEYRAHRGGNVYCTLAWIKEDHPGYQYLSEKIRAIVQQQNAERFHLGPLAPSFEQYQYTDYNQPGDAYGWHTDSGTRLDYLTRRRLTVTITLTDASEHGGGGFQLSEHVGHSKDPDPAAVYDSMQTLNDEERELLGKKGTLILFPSDRIHRALPVLSGTRKVLICWVSCPEPVPTMSEPVVIAPPKTATLNSTFGDIYKANALKSSESKSGTGSELKATATLRKELAVLLQRYDIKSMLDIPCGDFNWMKEVNRDGIDYTGADIVPDLIAHNRAAYPNVKFDVMDLTASDLPKVDLVLVRDCLGHLSDANVLKAIENIRRSGSKYLLATSFTKWDKNTDIADGGWRCINLMIAPFKLKPQYLINEDCREGYPRYNDKCMILFDLENVYSQ
jgi:predicted 2-oxoglutarate/Fe(II)-dependent dioxygenase YbiX